MYCTICKTNKIGPETKSSEPHSCLLSKEISEEIETQSRLSNEHLSMNSSEESLKQIEHQTCGEEANSLIPGEISTSISDGLNDCRTSKYSIVEKVEIVSRKSNERFMNKNDSTELCFNNTIENFKISQDLIPTATFCYKVEQPKFLSAEVLKDFDSQTVNSKNEGVNNYLETCHPTLLNPPPAYDCKHSGCQLEMESEKQKLELEMKSISTSTDSDPSLKSTCLPMPENLNLEKFIHQDYYILQALEVTPASQVDNLISGKSQNLPILDMRMKKILETFKEDIRINGLDEKSFLPKMPVQIPTKEQEEKRSARINSSNEDKNSDLIYQQLSNAYRAHCDVSPALSLSNRRPAQQEPPSPQFKRVPCSSANAQELLLKQRNPSRIKTVPASLLHIPRSPILCPESTCQRMIFVSDFNKHFVVDHSHLPMERITPFQCKNFFLDARLFKNGTNKCHLLYLMCDKIIGLGSTEYKDFLPILVMTSRISLHQMCDVKSHESSAPDYYLIWITGIVTDDLEISVSLTVWSRAGRTPSCHIVYSGQMYSIRNSQCALDVWQSGRMLLLSSQEIAILTNNGQEMLNLQLSVH